MAVRIASHLFRNRHGTFYFRWCVPSDLREHIKQREYRFSLGTEQRQQAKVLSMMLVAALPDLITRLREMANQEHRGVLSEGFDNYLSAWVEERRKNLNLQAQLDAVKNELLEAKQQLHGKVEKAVAERVVKAAYDKGQLKGRRDLEERLIFPWLPERTAPFTELRTAWLKSLVANRLQNGKKKLLSPKTLEEYGASTAFFITVMGNLRIGEIDRDIVGAYLDLLKRLPANISRMAKYRNKSIEEIVAMGDTPQSPRNISKKLEHASSMFKWALDEKRKWGIDANPFAGYGQADNGKSKRRPFTIDEMKAILGHKSYVARVFCHPYMYWMTPLGTFTGARQGELAQLDLKDFVEIEGIHCIDINDIEAVEVKPAGQSGKKVKNENAKRLVPIHPALIEMGLLRYVERLREQGEIHLFPELNRERRDGPAHAVSNWFQGFRRSVGLNQKQETVFHSFRHLFITLILDTGVSPHMLAPIVGHEAELITGKVYWNTKDATKRLPTVEIFTLPEELMAMFPRIEDVEFKPTGRAVTRRAIGARSALV